MDYQEVGAEATGGRKAAGEKAEAGQISMDDFIERATAAVMRGLQSSLNPQPLPPKETGTEVGLNPQPEPPGTQAQAPLNPQPLPPIEITVGLIISSDGEIVRARGFKI